ncbi:MAG: ATP-binding cassette domain-containing protein [Bacteroidales bacterium]|nr:ATP-binding cassette domain-containing protein [Bacteroidales bacterium]
MKLVVDSVTVRFGQKTVLSGGYITSQTGMVTGLLGRNGAGKSCMFRALMGGLKVEYVIVNIDGEPIDLKRIGRRIKYLPQGRMIPEGMTLKRAFELYRVDFWEFALQFPQFTRYAYSRLWEMSGGEARLAELYLVLMTDGDFCILDEPFSQIAPLHIEAVQRMIREKSREKGIIVTDHNYEAISQVTDNLFVIADGYTFPVESRDDLVRHGYLRPA